MKIGFDARLINETGVGRYIRNILPQLIKNNKKNTWVVSVRKSEKEDLEKLIKKYKDRVEIKIINARWHSFLEQLLVPLTFYKANVDILHIPYINVPFFYHKKIAVTIHDLTVLTNKTGRASTLNPVFYFIKRIGYRLALWKALKSYRIFTVTNSVKEEIHDLFPKVEGSKVIVTYNGFTRLKAPKTYRERKELKDFFKANKLRKKDIKGYFFYVGNAHPHKNLNIMVDTLARFFSRFPDYKMVIAGKRDYFMEKILEKISTKKSKENFCFFEEPTDGQLYRLYRQSKMVILPSLKEGFGLQILEAMQLNTLILCSDIPSYKEVGKDMCEYFDPKSKRSLVLGIHRVLKTTKKEKEKLIKNYNNRIKYFSWKESAKETLKHYQDGKEKSKTKKLIIRNFGIKN